MPPVISAGLVPGGEGAEDTCQGGVHYNVPADRALDLPTGGGFVDVREETPHAAQGADELAPPTATAVAGNMDALAESMPLAGEDPRTLAPSVRVPAVPAHRVQLARALADGLVAAVAAGDQETAKVALGMLRQFMEVLV